MSLQDDQLVAEAERIIAAWPTSIVKPASIATLEQEALGLYQSIKEANQTACERFQGYESLRIAGASKEESATAANEFYTSCQTHEARYDAFKAVLQKLEAESEIFRSAIKSGGAPPDDPSSPSKLSHKSSFTPGDITAFTTPSNDSLGGDISQFDPFSVQHILIRLQWLMTSLNQRRFKNQVTSKSIDWLLKSIDRCNIPPHSQ